MSKLIKLKNDHYIIVDDSQINKGDYCLMFDDSGNIFLGNEPQQYLGEKAGHYLNKGLRKITHSTQSFNFDFMEPLVLSEVKELIGEVDVEKKAREIVINNNPFGSENFSVSTFNGLVKDITKALEDNKEKKYTEEDLRKAWNAAYIDAMSIDEETYKPLFFEDFIQSLQPKTEWEVEIVDGKLKLK